MVEKKVFIDSPLVWIDLEMTGLSPQEDVILEISVILTDSKLVEIARGPNLIISKPKERLDSMNEWCTRLHGSSGLTAQVLESTLSLADAEQQVMDFLKQHCRPGESPLCGNSVWQDKMFMVKHMPAIVDFLHYRIIDVSTIKQLVQRWYQSDDKNVFKKKETHRALDDIEESIEELKWYKKGFFIEQ